jgi:elongation factor P
MSAIDIRVGNIIRFEGGRYRVLKTMHVKPGKGGAFMQVEMKEINHGTKKNQRFRSDETVERLIVDTYNCQFMYANGDDIEVMNNDTYEQFTIPISFFEDGREKFLADGMELKVDFIGDDIVNIVLPQKLKGKVQQTEPYMKGQTATQVFKPALLENGLTVTVPPFVKEGDEVLINTETMEYDSRG